MTIAVEMMRRSLPRFSVFVANATHLHFQTAVPHMTVMCHSEIRYEKLIETVTEELESCCLAFDPIMLHLERKLLNVLMVIPIFRLALLHEQLAISKDVCSSLVFWMLSVYHLHFG